MPQADESSTVLLIIDSSSFIIERLVTMLKEVKIVKKIFTATDYDTALDALQKTKTDIVLLYQLDIKITLLFIIFVYA